MKIKAEISDLQFRAASYALFMITKGVLAMATGRKLPEEEYDKFLKQWDKFGDRYEDLSKKRKE